MAEAAATRARLRLRFSKLGKVRFTSHRDTARSWERALRRADVPVAYTEGFSPRPRVSFGLALSTGHESLGEYLDVDVSAAVGPVDLRALTARLDPALPAGVAVQGAAVVEPGTPSLQEAVTSCVWRLEVVGADPGEVGVAVERLLDADHLVVQRERKGKQVHEDLRSAVLDLALAGTTPSGTELVAELATSPRAVRPGDVADALCADLPGASAGRVCRTHQFTGAELMRREPLPTPPELDGWSLAAGAPDLTEGPSDVRRPHDPSGEGGRAG
jgi:radical SAM-linked protein